MGYLCHFLSILAAIVLSAFGANMALAVPVTASEISFYQVENALLSQAADVGFAARAPPLDVSNVAVTGGFTSMQGSAFALHEQETVAAIFGFDADHNATNTGLGRSQIDEIVGAPKGQRPDPSDYMSQTDIDNHLSLFDDGAVRLTPTSNVERFGNAGPDGGFLMPRSEFNRIVRETGGDLTQLENRLGLNTGDLTSGNVSALSIDRADLGNLRLPSGNEGGAINNPNWRPGGYTSGGVPEAVADISSAPFEDVTNLLTGR